MLAWLSALAPVCLFNTFQGGRVLHSGTALFDDTVVICMRTPGLHKDAQTPLHDGMQPHNRTVHHHNSKIRQCRAAYTGMLGW
jgi:hypothetical protein